MLLNKVNTKIANFHLQLNELKTQFVEILPQDEIMQN